MRDLSLSLVLALASLACVDTAYAEQSAQYSVLVFSRTTGYRHESIAAGIAAIQQLGMRHGFAVEASEASSAFSDEQLKRYRAVVFLNTTGDVLDQPQQAAFERYIEGGGGYVGVHSASDTEYDWPWYGKLVGAYFRSHPPIQAATLSVVDGAHVSTRHLPKRWQRTDEWYNFRSVPNGVNVLVRIDEKTYSGGAMGQEHPLAWCHEVARGRAWYTALGHTSESYSDPLFLDHLSGGIAWAARASEN
jgi:type 1 glutamine amidotransferase